MLESRHAFTVLAVLALAAGTRAQAASCSRGWVCVERVEQAGQVEIVARNLREHPLTLSLAMRARDLAPRHRRTVTRTLAGGARVVLARIPHTPGGDYRFEYDWTVGSQQAEHDDEYLYRLPFAPGSSHRVLQGFDTAFSHTGLERFTVDFDLPVGTAVHAARGGVVAMVQEAHDIGCWQDSCSRYANYIVVLHDDGTTGEYYHLAKDGALVAEGDRVGRGQLIARSGNTGHTTMPHLHFGVYTAVAWGRTRSVPIRFESDQGVIERPQAGVRYRLAQ